MQKWFTRATVSAFALLLTLTALSSNVYAQTTVTQTTLSASVALPTQTAPARLAVVASATNITVGSEVFVDAEAMLVTGVNGTTLTVQRGYDATKTAPHANSAIVYVGQASGVTGSPFVYVDPPIGSCTLTSEQFSLRINVVDGNLWQCTNSQWMNVVDAFAWIGPGNCYYTTSGGTFAAQTNVGVTGTTGLGLVSSAAGVASLPVLEVSTTNAGTATNTISCTIPVPSRVNAPRGSYVVDATFAYGIYQNTAGTQAAVLASGTMNGQAVFTTVTLPAAGTSETGSVVAPVRWDSGTLAITPVVASFNTTALTVGQFYTAKFVPATPLAMTSDLTSYQVNLSILCAATTATSIATPGVLVHYRYVTGM